MATAFISGVIFSIMTYFLSVLHKGSLIQSFSYGEAEDNKTDADTTDPTRSRYCPVCNQPCTMESQE